MAKRAKTKAPSRHTGNPTCNCILLCDNIVVSHADDKHNLLGVIGAITLPPRMMAVGPFVVYVRLSNVHANQKVEVCFEDAESETRIWAFVAELVNRNDPLAVYTLLSRVPAFLVPRAGRYLLSAKHGGVALAQTPIQINCLAAPDEKQQ